ncbi:MAG: histidinol-phosphate aminotransferase family protein [Myxococcales bacterium]|nr:histidinol-phosphate aminotransferase family protein [Myxococcales bacterium]MCB9712688.1 histidinol-phosphate aminotransferase family protein [Myxococcales bacterium]
MYDNVAKEPRVPSGWDGLSRFVDERRLLAPAHAPRRPHGLVNLSNNVLVHPVTERLFERFAATHSPMGLAGYPELAPVKEAISEVYALPPQAFLLTAGSDLAIKELLFSMGARATCMILQTPNYVGYESYARQAGVEVVPVPHASGQPLVDDLAAEISAREGSLVVVTTPNPVHGMALSSAQLEGLARHCREGKCLLVLDAAYMAYGGPDYSCLPMEHDNVVVIRSFSKSHGFAGLRAALVIADPAITSYLARANLETPISELTARFLEYCLRHEDEFVAARRELIAGRERMNALLRHSAPHWWVWESEGNFSACDARSEAAVDELHRHLRDHGFVFRELRRWSGYTSCFRITCADERTTTALERAIRTFDGPSR